ncbi:MAG: LacI family DNA-binding transcriptional regulator [Egibacteraceae bacterium]
MAATLRDVALRADVSLATVSRVLNGSQRVDPTLAARVRTAADDLGYRANLLARGLRRQRTDIVGLVVPQVGNPFFSALMQAVSRHLQQSARTVLLADAEDDPDLERQVITRLADHGVDGILCAPVSEADSGVAAAEIAARLPLVFLDRAAADVEADTASVDQRRGVDLVLDHLVEVVGAHPATRLVSATPVDSAARARCEAYADAVAEGRVDDPAPPLLGEFTVDWGREAATALVADGALPRALVCGNDLIALGVLAGLAEQGVRVPADVVVTGFDDVGFATLAAPSLTTVRQPLDALAATAVELLEQRIGGSDGPARCELLAPELIVRASTVAPR